METISQHHNQSREVAPVHHQFSDLADTVLREKGGEDVAIEPDTTYTWLNEQTRQSYTLSRHFIDEYERIYFLRVTNHSYSSSDPRHHITYHTTADRDTGGHVVILDENYDIIATSATNPTIARIAFAILET